MTILVAVSPGRRDGGAVPLGLMLSRSTVEDLLLVSVVPAPWPPVASGADEEYLTLQEGVARTSLAQAREQLGGGPLAVESLVRRASSVSAGLLDVMAEREVSQVVVGSSSTGLLGRVMLGSVADRLLHSSDVPVVVAPRGYQPARDAHVTRISVAVGRADRAGALLTRAAEAARRSDLGLRVVCFAVRPMADLTGGVEEGPERLVVEEWAEGLARDVESTLASGPAAGPLATRVEVVVGQGTSWSEALHDVRWVEGDVMVVGTSSNPLSRFFLGSHASKIVRSSPVPVVLLSRA